MGRAKVETAAAPPKLSDAELEQIHAETRRLDVSQKIAYWDKRQGAVERVDVAGNLVEKVALEDGGEDWPAGSQFQRARTVVCCPNDKTHGALAIVGSRSAVPGAIAGSLLICGARKGGAFCTGSVPV